MPKRYCIQKKWSWFYISNAGKGNLFKVCGTDKILNGILVPQTPMKCSGYQNISIKL